ncbi:hypothetical protein O6H91_10G093900 [Diphasiastrum complanatum]|nr:hypothetical protein O6H91_10G093900 [Diphasiastrum complanatum]
MVQIGEACFSADSLNRTWALASDYFQPGSEHRIHAHRHYGFENKDVLERLSHMQKEHNEKDISQNHTLLNSSTLQHSTKEEAGQKNGRLNKYSEATESNETAVKEEPKSFRPLTCAKKIGFNEGPFGDSAINDGFNKPDKNSKMQALTHIPNNDLFNKMVRLRSKLLTESISEKDNIAGLLRDFKGFMRPQAGRSISASLQTASPSNYSDNSGSRGIFARVTSSEPQGLSSESGRFFSDARKFIAADRKVHSQEEDKSVVSSRQQKHLKNLLPEETSSWDKNGKVHIDTDVASISNKQSDVSLSRLRTSSLWESSVFKSSARGTQSSYVLNELLQYWKKTDMLPGETIPPTDNEISMHSGSDKAELEKEAQEAEEMSDFNEEVSVIERMQGFVSNKKFEEAISLFKRHDLTAAHLSKAFFPFKLDDWQTLALQYLNGGDSVLVCAPCGAGKSVIATFCLYESVLKDKRAIFVTPFVGLAYQHFLAFQKTFGESRVGGAWEATRVQMHAKILVVTLEFLVKELRDQIGVETSKKTILSEGLNIVVLDKFFVAIDGELGSFWEEAVMLMDSQVKLLALSLPATNADHLVSWISNIHRPCKLVQRESEPVPRKYFSFDSTGLHELSNLKLSAVNGSLKSSFSSNSEVIPRKNPKNTTSNVHPGLGSIAIPLRERSMLPAVVFFHDPEECITATKDILKAISNGLSSKGEIDIIEKRLNKLLETTPEYLPLVEEDREGLRHGIVAHHDLQVPFWKQFVDALIQDDLVQLVLTTQNFFCRTKKRFKTAVVNLKPKIVQDEVHFIRKISQQQGLAGRRGIEEYGNVVFLGSQTSATERVGVLSQWLTGFSSYFTPSYSLLVNLLSKFDSIKVKEVIDSNFSRFAVKNVAEKELRQENQSKLQSAAVFTRVDVRLKDMEERDSYLLSGVMLAIAPGPCEHLYMILCADNKFRLVPAGALESIYSEEPPLDLAHKMATGITLKQPSPPKRRRWLPDPVGCESYVAKGTPESAQLVEVLHQNPLKSHAKAEKEMREGASWDEAQKKISVLERAGTLSLHKPAIEIKQHNPLATLIAGLHYLENELWVSMVLTSSFIKPLTPPELASICSTLVFRAENFDILNEDKFKLSYKVPKRIQETLSKMEALREHVANMEGSPTDSLSFDVTPAAMVHAWIRGKPCIQNIRFNSVNDGATASILQSTLRLLQQINMTCTESSRKGQDLDGFLGLASISRRAAFLMNRDLIQKDISSYIK